MAVGYIFQLYALFKGRCFLGESSTLRAMNEKLRNICISKSSPPCMIFITQYPLFFSNFYCGHCDLESAFVWFFFSPPLCDCRILLLNPLHPNDLCDGFLVCPTLLLLTKRGIYGSVSTFSQELWRKQCEKSGLGWLNVSIWPYTMRASVMTGHCPSHRVLQFSADALYSGGDTRRDAAGR